MKFMFAVLAALTSLNAQAALSGYYDSTRKISAAMTDSVVANSLKQEPIVKIEVQGLTLVIETESCRRTVVLRTVPPARGTVGATNYEVASLGTDSCP